jgi:hypothetical protein
MGGIEKSLETNINDMFSHSEAIIHDDIYALNDEYYEGYQWIAALDSVTCLVCAALDNKIFDRLPGGPTPPFTMKEYTEAPEHPLHNRCRCIIVPVLEGMRDDPSQTQINYKDWFDRQDNTTKLDILGPSRYSEYLKGRPVTAFAKDDHILTLKELGIDRITRREIAAGGLTPEKESVKMGTLGEKLPEEFINGMREKLEATPEPVQRAWNNMAGKLKIVDAHYRGKEGNYFSPKERGILFDSVKDSKMRVFPGKGNLEPKYSAAFHELFHNISSEASARVGMSRYMDFADVFQSKIHQGMTLTEMLQKEAEDRITQVFNQLREEAIKAGLKSSSVIRGDVYKYITQELRNIPVYEHCDISDMWDGCTKHKIRGFMGHRIGYWNTTSVGIEAFAEMGNATINHPESLNRIKEYFPKSYEIFLEMIDFIGGL